MRSKRVISFALVLLFSVAMVLSPCINVKADSFPSEFYVNSNVYYTAEELGLAYLNLNLEQQDIANYLMGMYNMFYMGARGFQFKAGTYTNQSSFIANVKKFGYRLLYGAIDVALYSRFDAEFCKYASAVILYASQCNVTFDTWFENLDDDFVIPVDQAIINSFTLMYNDNSDLGIAEFGNINTPWESGTAVVGRYSGYPFDTDRDRQLYNSFMNNYSPVLWSNVPQEGRQACAGSGTYAFPDTLYIKRGNNFLQYCYGYTSENGTRSRVTNEKFPFMRCLGYSNNTVFGWVSDGYSITSKNFSNSIYSTPTTFDDISDFIYYVFEHDSPCGSVVAGTNRFNWNGAYPFIGHVVFVDDLNTLSNPEEIFNVDQWDITSGYPNPTMLLPIDKVGLKPKNIVTVDLPDNTNTAVAIQDIIDEYDGDVVDDNDDPVNPWQVTVVVQPNNTNPISVDVNMFNGGTSYIDYLWQHTMKVAQYAKDLLDCFDFTADGGDSYGPKFAIYGVLVLGVAGGLVAKFLL